MLNELADLRRSLAEQGIQTAPWHPFIQPLRPGLAVIAEVNSAGVIVHVSRLSPEQALDLRNITPDRHNSFPAFNLNVPLFVDAGATENAARGAEELETLIANAPMAWSDGEKKKYTARIRHSFNFCTHPVGRLVVKGSAAANPILGSTRALLDSLAKVNLDPASFVRSFSAAAISSVRSGSLDVTLLNQILFSTLDKVGKRKSWKLLIFLDVADAGTYSHRVADPTVASEWNKALLAPTAQKTTPLTMLCAIAGTLGEPVGKNMPEPKLPIVGLTLLMSMNKDVPAQTRYGQTSTGIFPMTKQTAFDLYNALRRMTAPEREGKTWAKVGSGTKKNPDLLIVYLEKDTEGELRLASALGDDEDWEEDGESSDAPNQQVSGARFTNGPSSFESRTKRLIEAIQLKSDLMQDDAFLRVFVISTIDKGRKQVLFDQRYGVSALFRARERWIAGSRNVPPITIFLPQGKGKRARLYSEHVPTPVAVLKSLRQQWIREGTMNQTVPGVDLRRVYSLLLEESAEREAMWMLERLLPLSQVLLIGAGRPYTDQKKTGEVHTLQAGAGLPVEARRSLLTVIALYGILLHRLGRYKENYMEGRDYLLGQFLQCADDLHLLYCEQVRGGRVPPQLIGNAAMPMALENPAKAVEVLAARVPVYVAWLKQSASIKIHLAADGVTRREFSELNETESSAVTAKSISRRLGELSAALKGKLDTPISLTGRAELLLGYLAREPRPAHLSEDQSVVAPLPATHGENA